MNLRAYHRSGTVMDRDSMFFPQKLTLGALAQDYSFSLTNTGADLVQDPSGNYIFENGQYILNENGGGGGYYGGESYSASSGGGIFSEPGGGSTAPVGAQLESVINSILRVAQAGQAFLAKQQLDDLNMQRARTGLPPLSVPGVNTPARSSGNVFDSKKIMDAGIWLGLGFLAWKVIGGKGGAARTRRRRRRR